MQSTIDMMKNWGAAREMKQQGKQWSNPYDLGPVANWQVLLLWFLITLCVEADLHDLF